MGGLVKIIALALALMISFQYIVTFDIDNISGTYRSSNNVTVEIDTGGPSYFTYQDSNSNCVIFWKTSDIVSYGSKCNSGTDIALTWQAIFDKTNQTVHFTNNDGLDLIVKLEKSRRWWPFMFGRNLTREKALD